MREKIQELVDENNKEGEAPVERIDIESWKYGEAVVRVKKRVGAFVFKGRGEVLSRVWIRMGNKARSEREVLGGSVYRWRAVLGDFDGWSQRSGNPRKECTWDCHARSGPYNYRYVGGICKVNWTKGGVSGRARPDRQTE